MAREYPRFLFQNPSNTKSKGPFIVHLIKPKMICKVYERRTAAYNASEHPNALNFGRFAIELLEAWDVPDKKDYVDVLFDMANWLRRQIESGEIDLPQPIDDRPF